MKKALPIVLLLSLILVFSGCGGDNEPAPSSDPGEQTSVVNNDTSDGKFRVATLAQIDAWPVYNAVVSGEAEKYGFSDFQNKDIITFDSGIDVIEGIPAEAFSIGDVGAIPTLMASLRFDAVVVGIAADESPSNAIIARPENPVFERPDAENDELFGDAETVKGKTILMTSVSSAHFILQNWLGHLGLSEDDVTIKMMDQQTAVTSFDSGEGDFLVLWSPNLYRAYEKGYKEVANAADLGAPAIMFYVAPREWAESHKKEIANFLAMTSAQVEVYQEKEEELAPDIAKFFLEYGGIKMSDQDTKEDIARHKLFTVEEQIKLIEDGTAEKWLNDNGEYFEKEGKIKPEELASLQDKSFNLDVSYLKAAKEASPSK